MKNYQIRSQWQFLQNEGIKKEWCQLDENEDNSSTSGLYLDLYWVIAEELCGIESNTVKQNMKRIDDFWEVYSPRDEKGCQKYLQLVALVKCFLFLSQGNSTPVEIFNKQIDLGSKWLLQIWRHTDSSWTC